MEIEFFFYYNRHAKLSRVKVFFDKISDANSRGKLEIFYMRSCQELKYFLIKLATRIQGASWRYFTTFVHIKKLVVSLIHYFLSKH